MRYFRWMMPLAALLLLTPSALAQTRRVDDMAERLVNQTTQMAEQSYRDFADRSRNTRADVEALFQDEQVKASAELFLRMVRDRRPRMQLQNASAVMETMARSADRYGRQRALMSDIQRTINDIQRELNFGGGGGPGPGPGGPGFPSSGSVRWRGTIDDVAQIRVQDSYIEVRAASGTPYSDGTYNFTSALPNRRVTVSVNKLRGRGSVRVIQQPARNNDFTAVIEVRDSDRGPDSYEIEISW